MSHRCEKIGAPIQWKLFAKMAAVSTSDLYVVRPQDVSAHLRVHDVTNKKQSRPDDWWQPASHGTMLQMGPMHPQNLPASRISTWRSAEEPISKNLGHKHKANACVTAWRPWRHNNAGLRLEWIFATLSLLFRKPRYSTAFNNSTVIKINIAVALAVDSKVHASNENYLKLLTSRFEILRWFNVGFRRMYTVHQISSSFGR